MQTDAQKDHVYPLRNGTAVYSKQDLKGFTPLV